MRIFLSVVSRFLSIPAILLLCCPTTLVIINLTNFQNRAGEVVRLAPSIMAEVADSTRHFDVVFNLPSRMFAVACPMNIEGARRGGLDTPIEHRVLSN